MVQCVWCDGRTDGQNCRSVLWRLRLTRTIIGQFAMTSIAYCVFPGSKSTDHETKAKIDISIINWFAWQPEHRRYIAAVSHRSEARPSWNKLHTVTTAWKQIKHASPDSGPEVICQREAAYVQTNCCHYNRKHAQLAHHCDDADARPIYLTYFVKCPSS